ncbi:MAG: hypothetical protein AAF089_14765 [Bacteroidota bacterium]
MTFIHDHLVSLLIGSTVFLIVTAMTARLTEAKVEQASLYQVKAQSLDFAEWLEDDLAQLGEHTVGPLATRFAMPTHEGGQTAAFSFHRDLVSTTFDTTRVSIRYQLVATTGASYPDTTVQQYQVVRSTREAALLNGTPAWTTPWQPGGLSPATLTHFDIEPMTRLGQAAASPGDVAFLRVAFSLTQPPQGRVPTFRELHWATTLTLRED